MAEGLQKNSAGLHQARGVGLSSWPGCYIEKCYATAMHRRSASLEAGEVYGRKGLAGKKQPSVAGEAKCHTTSQMKSARRTGACPRRASGFRIRCSLQPPKRETSVQQTFLKAFIHLHKFEEKSEFRTWLTRITINESLMLLRKNRGLREVPIDDSIWHNQSECYFGIPDTSPGPEISYLHHEDREFLTAAVERLRPTGL